MTSSVLNCSHDLSENLGGGGGVHPSNPFCLTQLRIKETFSDVLGMMKGQHVGGKSSDKSYSSHWHFNTPTNLVTSSDTQGGAPGLALPRL